MSIELQTKNYGAEQMRTAFQRPDRVRDPLYVITPIFNPIRWRSRWKLYEDFARRVAAAGAVLYTIEAAYGNREFAIGSHEGLRGLGEKFIQVRVDHELWLKENLINVAAQHLPLEAKYIAWVDADVLFARDDWANETVQQLQHYDFVQMWSQYQDLCPNFEVQSLTRSYMDCYLHGGVGRGGNLEKRMTKQRKYDDKYPYQSGPVRGYPGAPGLAWAARRESFNKVGGLLDFTILGAGDWYMAHALTGRLTTVARTQAHSKNFTELMREWEARCERHVRRNVGVVKGLALHYWHGSKKHRLYKTRDQILVENKYDPMFDLKRDSQGVYQLSDQHNQRSISLRDDVRAYFRQRNEDGTDV